MVLQSVMTVCASSTESNGSRVRDEVLSVEANDSTNGFCHREPGSMKLRPRFERVARGLYRSL
jgi:hypothetical protein